MKVLFIDLDLIANSNNAQSLKLWIGFMVVGLSFKPQPIITGEEIARHMAIIKSTPKLKTIFIPTGDSKTAWEITNTGDVRKTPTFTNGIMEFYLGKYLTRPQSWIISDRPQSKLIIAGDITYINGNEWRKSLVLTT